MNRIEQGKHILKMIERCNDDTGKEIYDEINARFHLCLFPWESAGTWESIKNDETAPIYTHNRDALKQARPEGWDMKAICYGKDCNFMLQKDDILMWSNRLSTEELAELHAIIQAWIYIWKNEDVT